MWPPERRRSAAGSRLMAYWPTACATLTAATPTRLASRCSARAFGDRLAQADQAVVVTLATVDDAGPSTVGVGEEEEVVADQFHLEQRLVNSHRLGRMLLLADDQPWALRDEGFGGFLARRCRFDRGL